MNISVSSSRPKCPKQSSRVQKMEKKLVCCTGIDYFCSMRREIDVLGNVPVSSSLIASLYPDIKAKNNKVAVLERAGDIIRLKKGLFVAGSRAGGANLSLGLIANHLYAPSYVSMHSALRYYGLIPEAVYVTQSMTVKHSRDFTTPVGAFTYQCVSAESFPVGVTQVHDGDAVFVIATPEKALCDLIAYSPRLNLRYRVEASHFLEEDLRFDMEAFSKFNPSVFEEYIRVGRKANSVETILKLLTHE